MAWLISVSRFLPPVRALVTGSRGFLGRHLVGALARSFEVTSFKGDVCDAANWSRHDACDVVLHLAAVSNVPDSLRDPVRTWQVNVQGTVRLLEWARAGNAQRVVLVSTAHVYGPARYSPIDEQHPREPVSPYGASKLAAEAAVQSYRATYGMETVIVRPFNIYGPGQAPGFLVADILGPLARGVAPTLGDPRPVRDFTFVADAVNCLERAATASGATGLTVNLGTGVGHSVRDVAETARRVTGTTLDVRYDERKARAVETMELVVDNRLAVSRLGWKPEIDLEEGIARCWHHLTSGGTASEVRMP